MTVSHNSQEGRIKSWLHELKNVVVEILIFGHEARALAQQIETGGESPVTIPLRESTF